MQYFIRRGYGATSQFLTTGGEWMEDTHDDEGVRQDLMLVADLAEAWALARRFTIAAVPAAPVELD